MLAPVDRFTIERTLTALRGNYTHFHLVYPAQEVECAETGCGFDELTQSGKNTNCLVCRGTGQVIVWTTLEAEGRVQHYDLVKLVAPGLPPGIEIGDVVLYVSEEVKNAVEELRSSHFGYVYVDDDVYRPFSIQPTRVGRATEWRIELKRTEPNARASGY